MQHCTWAVFKEQTPSGILAKLWVSFCRGASAVVAESKRVWESIAAAAVGTSIRGKPAQLSNLRLKIGRGGGGMLLTLTRTGALSHSATQ